MDIAGNVRGTGRMPGAGSARERLASTLKAAFAEGLLSEQTLSHRLGLLFGPRLIEPHGVVGDLTLRAQRRPAGFASLRSALQTAGRELARILSRRRSEPAPLVLALDWSGAQEELLIGRGTACDIALSNLTVSRRRGPLASAGVLLALLLLAASGLAPARAGAAPTLSWLASTIDASGQPSAISCSSESLCVAVDRSGNALSSGDVTSPEAHWAATSIDKGQSLVSVACAARMCVAVDSAGRALTSTSPLAGAWSAPLPIDGGTALTGVACASESLCVAVDAAGGVLASSNPASPAASWPVQYKGDAPLRSVSCAASGGAAVDAAGNAVASGSPTGGAGAWRARAIDPAGGLSGVSCSASHGRLAVDGAGNAFASANPMAPAPTWSSTPIDPGGLTAVSCADTG